MIAEWLGGPFDGRLDEIPNGTWEVSVALPLSVGYHELLGPYSSNYVEVRCRIHRTCNHYVIVWHEPVRNQ